MKRLLKDFAKGTIILVHGAFEHSGRYEWLAEKWFNEGFNVLYGDLPGQGMSHGVKGHIESFDEYVYTIHRWIIEAEKINKPLFLLGHSMGGLVIIRYMQEVQPKNVSGVILSSPGLGILKGSSKWLYPISWSLNWLVPKLQIRTRLEPCISTRNKQYHNRHKDPLFVKRVSIHWFVEFQKAIRQAFQNIHLYPSVPTIIMQAGNDLLINVKDVRRWFKLLNIPNKRYNEWDNLYHEIFNEPEREEVFHYAKRFVDDVLNGLIYGGTNIEYNYSTITAKINIGHLS
jgi:lysophospholipase